MNSLRQQIESRFGSDPEYKLIKEHYGDRRSKRSGVPLIDHINEGLVILERLGAGAYVGLAYCLHPLVQSDDDFKKNWIKLERMNGLAVALTMEYRHVANAYLSTREIKDVAEIKLSPLYAVNDMLIADKVQNYKDFKLYHRGVHPRSDELEQYFNNWFVRLGIQGKLQEVLEACLSETDHGLPPENCMTPDDFHGDCEWP